MNRTKARQIKKLALNIPATYRRVQIGYKEVSKKINHYRKMKKLYLRYGMDAVVSYYTTFMYWHKIQADSKELSKG